MSHLSRFHVCNRSYLGGLHFTNWIAPHGHSTTFSPLSSPIKLTLSTHQQRKQKDGNGKSSLSHDKVDTSGNGPVNSGLKESYVENIRRILGARRNKLSNPSSPSASEGTLSGDFGKDKDETRVEKSEPVDLNPPTTCCMSGCQNCVWIDYIETLSKYYSDPSLGREKIKEDVMSIPDPNIRAVLIMELKFRGLW